MLTIHVSEKTATAVCEILVKLHNEAAEVLKVVDVISYDGEGKITSVRACVATGQCKLTSPPS